MFKNTQSGRSMIEMLGVLAIIGVLSAGGIAGYSMAMKNYKNNKALESIQMIATQAQTIYNGNYYGINANDMIALGVDFNNPFGGSNLAVGVVGSDTAANMKKFRVGIPGLEKDSCVKLAGDKASWGSMLQSLNAGAGTMALSGGNSVVNMSEANSKCTDATGETNFVVFTFK